MMRKKIDDVNQIGARGEGPDGAAVGVPGGGHAAAGGPGAVAAPTDDPEADPAVDAVTAAALPEDADVFDAVHGLMHALRAGLQAATRDPGGEAGGLSPMEGKTLGYFARHPGATQRELAEHAGRDKAQIARLVAGLRERGLLRAEADAVDRRQVRLYVTGPAAAHHAALMRQRRALAARAVQGFSPDERQALLQALARMRRNLEPGPDGRLDPPPDGPAAD